MTHSIRRLCLALFLGTCFSYSSAQEISNTGELITNSQQEWSGCSTPTSGAFWGGYSGGPCPGIDSSGQIIFSYGETTLSQTISLATALANSGSGLQINGYNYSWWVKNSNINGQQPGGYDNTAYVGVTLYNRDGTVAESDLYNYGYYIPEWTRFSGVRTYSSALSLSQVDNITLSVTGRDDGYWAGYYGPEFRNFSLSVNYSMDPCASDPLYSSSCPGYLEAYMAQLAYLLGWNTSESDYDLIEYSLPTTVSFSSLQEDYTTIEPVVDAGGIEVSTTGELSVPDGIPEIVKEDKKEIDPNLLSNILRKATDDSKALSIVNQSIQDSISEDANPDFSMTNETLQAIQQQTERSQHQLMQAQESLLQEQLNEMSETTHIDNNSLQFTGVAIEDIIQSLEVTSADIPTQIKETIEGNAFNAEIIVEEETKTNTSNVDALAVIQNSLPSVIEDTKEEKEVLVNQKVEPNQAASGTDISDIAISPIGFNDYLTKNIIDSKFYEDKEIYTGQVVVDNRRAQRLLSGASDRLHKEMVDQQYRP